MRLQLTQSDIVEALGPVPLFSALTKRHLKALARVCSAVVYEAGQTIFKEHDTAQHMAVVLAGTAKVVRGGRTVADIGVGDAIGEMSLIDGAPRSATVVADTTVDAVLIYATDFRRLLQEEPSICNKLLLAQTARVRDLDHRLAVIG